MVGTRLASRISLLDLTSDKRFAEWYVLYYHRKAYFWWQKYIKQGFRHCELWRPYKYGNNNLEVVWLRVTPTFELLESEIDFDPTPPWIRWPGATAQKVQVLARCFKVREKFHFGPVTCTETVKNALAINAFWVWTPWQLYRYIKQRNGVIRADE